MIPKFRAWDKRNKEMLEVEEIDFVNETLFLRREAEFSVSWIELNFQHVIIIQSTGLNDVHGKEIFEGDIVQCWHEKGFVVMERGCWSIKIQPNDRGNIGALYDYDKEAKIIGNIHEHSDLLK